MRHVNIPIFIPHMGCPCACVFCNQRKISGVSAFSLANVRGQIDAALSTVGKEDEVEIAFFGGSFTAIERPLMLELLSIGREYIKKGRVGALRCSTRPDCIDDDVLDILYEHGMRTVELGLQSINDDVLTLSKRGHTAADAKRACKLIVERGISLVGQMMLGLPGSSLENELETARFICECGARAARIYPTVVFHGTELAQMTHRGEYLPLSNEEAVRRGGRVLRVFYDNRVPVIRIGLCASEELACPDTVLAGADHPALGEEIMGEMYFQLILEKIRELSVLPKELTVCVNFGELSKAVGHKKKNKLRLLEIFHFERVRFLQRTLCENEYVSLG